MSSLIISPDIAFAGEEAPPFPFTHGRILYDNKLLKSGVSIIASSASAGFPIESITNPLTAEQWRPTASPATINIDFGAVESIDSIGIGAHNFATTGTTTLVEYSFDDVTWYEFADFSAVDNKAVMLFSTSTIKARYWRMTFTYSGSDPQIGAIYMGVALALQRPVYGGITPITMARKTEYVNNRSNTNQFMGRSILRQGINFSVPLKNLTAAWYRENMEPFAKAARTTPFFYAWNPEQYPDEAGYAWTTADIVPTNQGTRDLMDVTLQARGIQDD